MNRCNLKNKIRNSLDNRWFVYTLSFFIPALFIVSIFSILQICPFGQKNSLVVDLDGQYIDFLSYFKTVFYGNNNFFYTFSSTLGSNVFGFSSYYLFSPFNFLALPFSKENLPVAVVIIIVLKIGLSGLTFNLFLRNISKNNHGLISLIFSTSYALMAFNTSYYYTIIWLDGVILLPIVIIGVNKILYEKKCLIYIISLFLSLLTSYYIGFMIFIFSILFFLYSLLKDSTMEQIKNTKIAEIKCFVYSSIFVCGISMFLILPVFLSLVGSKIHVYVNIKIVEIALAILFLILLILTLLIVYHFRKNKIKFSVFDSKDQIRNSLFNRLLSPISFKLNLSVKSLISLFILFLILFFFYSIAPIIGKNCEDVSVLNENLKLVDVLSNLFTSSFSLIQIDNWSHPQTALPQIFSGIFILFLVFLYFFNSTFSKRQKICSFSFICVFLISFCLVAIGLVWHGFSKPVWFPARFSFLFSFLLIYIANNSFFRIKNGINSRLLLYSAISLILLASVTTNSNVSKSGVNKSNIFFDILLIVFFSLFIYIFFDIRNKDLLSNNPIFIPQIHKEKVSRILFATFILLHFSNLYVNSFHSINETVENYSPKNNYTNLCDYSDYIKINENIIKSIKLQDKSFYRIEKTYSRSANDPMQFDYAGLSHFSSSEKYFTRIFMEKLGFKHYGNYLSYEKGNTITSDSLLGVKYILSNDSNFKKPYTLYSEENGIKVYKNQFAFPLGLIVNQNILDSDFEHKESDPFRNQECLLKSTSEKDYGDLFKKLEPVEIIKENLMETTENDRIKFSKLDGNNESYISYKLNIKKDSYSYAYFECERKNIYDANIYINGESTNSTLKNDGFNQIIPLKPDENGEVSLKIKLNKNSLTLNKIIFCSENVDVLRNYHKDSMSQQLNINKISSSHLVGDINLNEDKLLIFTFPYEEGWHIKVDNCKTQKIKVGSTLMAISMPKGEHKIEMYFIPEGLIFGSAVSFLTILGAIVYMYSKKHKNQNL